MKRIGILTSGGDCQGLNATIRGVAKTLYTHYGDDVKIYGIIDGYRGLIYGEYREMQRSDFSGILTRGGTILGTSRQPFKLMRVIDENSVDKVAQMKQHYKEMKLDCLVVLGGNGTQKTANLLFEEGLNVVGLPKTIDNDLWGTDVTFGFQSAVDIATNVIDCIHTTATSHGRVFIVELMGHKAGWLTLHAGIAGGADVILIPEIPYDINNVIKVVKERTKSGKNFSIIAVAEGAITKEHAAMKKKERKAAIAEMAYPSISYKIAHEIEEATGQETRVTVPGHFQRGGSPDSYDRFISTQFGVHAAELIIGENYGNLVVMQNNVVTELPLKEIAGKLKSVPPECQTVLAAKKLGISFGDE